MKIFTAAAIVISVTTMQPASADMLSTMMRYQGMHEVKNRKPLKAMLGIDVRRIPWCGAMMAYVAKKNGRKPPNGFAKAASWKSFGRAVRPSMARRGDIAVVRHGGHVIVFDHWKGRKACGPSGNSSNSVKQSCYGGVVAVRR